MLKRYIKIDETGLYLADALVDDRAEIDLDGEPITPATHIETIPADGFILPKWDGAQWIEGGIYNLLGGRIQKTQELHSQLKLEMDKGFSIANKIASSDAAQIEKLNNYAIRLAFGLSYPTSGLRFILKDGTEVTVSNASQFQNGFLAWGNRVKQLNDYFADVLIQINSANSKAELDAIDIINGWPAI